MSSPQLCARRAWLLPLFPSYYCCALRRTAPNGAAGDGFMRQPVARFVVPTQRSRNLTFERDFLPVDAW